MDSKIFVLAIIALCGVFSVIQSKQKAEAKKQKLADQEASSGLRKEHEDLKKRVEVLERIVTDKRSRLSDEIDNL